MARLSDTRTKNPHKPLRLLDRLGMLAIEHLGHSHPWTLASELDGPETERR